MKQQKFPVQALSSKSLSTDEIKIDGMKVLFHEKSLFTPIKLKTDNRKDSQK